MSLLTRKLDPQALAAELDRDGFVCVEGAIDPTWLSQAQDWIRSMVERKGTRYFAINWPAREAGTPAAELLADDGVKRVMNDLARLGCPTAKLDDEIYNVLRVVAGATGDSKSLIYHYDKYVITALVPILIPPGPKRKAGELLVFPNKRGYRRLPLLNVIEKAVVQSPWYRRWFTSRLPEGELDGIKYLKPGNLYFFWGYRTYHSNFPVSGDMVRGTLLMHHGDPHPDSLLIKAATARQVRKEKKVLEHGNA